MLMKDRPVYSYRDDLAVPSFPDQTPVVFMDGECAFCSRAARTISALDTADEFKICPTQSQLGHAVLAHYGLDPEDPDTWLYLVDGRAYTSLDAVMRVGKRLGGSGRITLIFAVLPKAAQDWLYKRIARNRYSIMGRTDMCAIPDPELQRRMLK